MTKAYSGLELFVVSPVATGNGNMLSGRRESMSGVHSEIVGTGFPP